MINLDFPFFKFAQDRQILSASDFVNHIGKMAVNNTLFIAGRVEFSFRVAITNIFDTTVELVM